MPPGIIGTLQAGVLEADVLIKAGTITSVPNVLSNADDSEVGFGIDLSASFAAGRRVEVRFFENSVLGDVNRDGDVNLLDVARFVEAILSGNYQLEADINRDQSVDLLDVASFVELLSQ